jgi:hypothetical protein
MWPRLIILFAFFATSSAHAYCGRGNPSIEQEFEDSDVVLRGLVTAESHAAAAGSFEDGTFYTVSVAEALRGKVGKTLRLFSENSSGRFQMTKGREYILFASMEQGRLSVDNCGNSGELPGSAAVLVAARKLAKTPNTSMQPTGDKRPAAD